MSKHFSCPSIQANVEMRKRIQKQHSLPAEPQRSRLKESIMAVTKSKQFESLKAGISSLVGSGEPKKQPSLPEEPEDSPKPETGEGGGGGGGEGAKGDRGKSDERGKKQLPKQTSSKTTAGTTTTTTTQVGTATLGSGIVRIWQSLSQGKQSESFTHKRGVTIQPLVVDGSGGGGATARRSLFQRRSQRGSPISPKQQFEVIAASEAGSALSPTLRKCCMDCPAGGDLVIVQQEGARERRSSRGDANSDSSSKDGSIQSDTSLDSEDSCVSVIFVPHPELEPQYQQQQQQHQGQQAPNVAELVLAKQRSTSNSSESSSGDSVPSLPGGGESGRGSPMSPIRVPGTIGSPIKTQGGKKMAATAVIDPSTSKIIGTAYVDEAVDFSSFGAESMVYFVERSLESIEERTTESEESDDGDNAGSVREKVKEETASKKAEEEKVILQRRLSGPKSFEMEDLNGGGHRGPNLKAKRKRSPNAPPRSAAAVLDNDGTRRSASRDGILYTPFLQICYRSIIHEYGKFRCTHSANPVDATASIGPNTKINTIRETRLLDSSTPSSATTPSSRSRSLPATGPT